MADFEKGKLYLNGVFEKTIGQLEESLLTYRYVLLEGAEGRGKSITAKAILWRWIKGETGSPLSPGRTESTWDEVWFCDLSREPEANLSQLVKRFGRLCSERKALFVVDNVHGHYLALDQLLTIMEVNFEKDSASVLLVRRAVTRSGSNLYLNSPLEEWRWKDRNLPVISLNLTVEDVRLVLEHCMVNTAKDRPVQDEVLVLPNMEWIENEIGTNLRNLAKYVETWQDLLNADTAVPIGEIKRSQVLEHLIRRINSLTKNNEALQNTLLHIAAINKYDLAVRCQGTYLDKSHVLRLAQLGLVGLSRGYLCFFPHPTDATNIVDAIAYRDRANSQQITQELLTRYLQRTALNAREATSLFTALSRADESGMLSQLLTDTEVLALCRNLILQPGIPMLLTAPFLRMVSRHQPDVLEGLLAHYLARFGTERKTQCQELGRVLADCGQLGDMTPVKLFLQYGPDPARDLVHALITALDQMGKLKKLSPRGLTSRLSFLNQENLSEAVALMLRSVDPKRIARALKESNPQLLYWLLREIPESESSFAQELLEEYSSAKLATNLAAKGAMIARHIRKEMYRLGCALLYKQVSRLITSDEWAKMWQREPTLRYLYRFLAKSWPPLVGCMREQRNAELAERLPSLLRELLAQGTSISLQERYTCLGLLLQSLIKLRNDLLGQEVSLRIAREAPLVRVTPGHVVSLTIVMNRVRQMGGNEASGALVERVVQCLDLGSLLSDLPPQGLSYLQAELLCHPEGDRLADEIARRLLKWNPQEIAGAVGSQELARLLWHSLQTSLGSNPIEDWLRRNTGEIEAILLNAVARDRFHVLWSIYQCNTEISRKLATRMPLPLGEMEDVPDWGTLLLAGLLQVLEIEGDILLPVSEYADSGDTADWIPEQLSIIEIPFVVRAVEHLRNADLTERCLHNIADRLGRRNIDLVSWTEKYPFPNTKDLFQQCFHHICELMNARQERILQLIENVRERWAAEKGLASLGPRIYAPLSQVSRALRNEMLSRKTAKSALFEWLASLERAGSIKIICKPIGQQEATIDAVFVTETRARKSFPIEG